MKRKVMSLFIITAFMLAFTPTSPAFERHPHIQTAIEALRSAKDDLNHAAHDFGGHRVDAIHAIDEAIHQLEVCMQY